MEIGIELNISHKTKDNDTNLTHDNNTGLTRGTTTTMCHNIDLIR